MIMVKSRLILVLVDVTTMANSKFTLAALDSACSRAIKAPLPKRPSYAFRGCDSQLPSVVTNTPFVASTEKKVYTGSNMIGISTMHKSNAVPVFDQDMVVEISRMRR